MYRLNDLDFLNVIQPRFIPAIIQQPFSILKTTENQQWKYDLFNDQNYKMAINYEHIVVLKVIL